jgi:hypothetical protein
MFTHLFRRGTHPHPAARLRRITAALAVVTGSLLAWAAVVPAASAMITVPAGGALGPAPDVPPPSVVPVVHAGGMPGWQIALIALAAALVAATAAVFLDRARGSRRVASTTG